jgi:hypothetical protein
MKAEVTIEDGETLRIDAGAGTVLRIRSGRAWITQPADPRDYDLKAGKALTLNGQGLVLVKAYEPTLLDLYRDDPERLRQRIERDARAARTSYLHKAVARLACATVRVFRRPRGWRTQPAVVSVSGFSADAASPSGGRCPGSASARRAGSCRWSVR